MLSTFPSQYWSTIGLLGVFSLTGWSPQIQTGLHVSRPTQVALLIPSTYLYGIITLCDVTFQTLPVRKKYSFKCSYYPANAVTMTVWADSFSIATTKEIDVSFFSSGYLDVSVPLVRSANCSVWPSTIRVAPFGNLRIKTCLQFPEAYRSLPRPSSPTEA